MQTTYMLRETPDRILLLRLMSKVLVRSSPVLFAQLQLSTSLYTPKGVYKVYESSRD